MGMAYGCDHQEDETMSEICPTCGEDSLMMATIGFIFGVMPWCANEECSDYNKYGPEMDE